MWGYRPIIGADSPAEHEPELDEWIRERMEWLMTEEPGELPSFFAGSMNDVDVSRSDTARSYEVSSTRWPRRSAGRCRG